MVWNPFAKPKSKPKPAPAPAPAPAQAVVQVEPESDEEWNRKVYASIDAMREQMLNSKDLMDRSNIEIDKLYASLRNIIIEQAGNMNASCDSNQETITSLIAQVEYYTNEFNLAKNNIAALAENIRNISSELLKSIDANSVLNRTIASLQIELNQIILLQNNTQRLLNEANDIIKNLNFNHSASDTRAMITDLNQPYVKHGDDLVAMLSKYIPKTNADATYQKIEYREAEFQKLKNINNIINIVYYIGVVFLFVLLFTSNNVFLKERFLFYIFLLVFPFLYPWVYLFVIKIWTYLFPDKLFSGPTNAFIDQTKQPNVYYN